MPDSFAAPSIGILGLGTYLPPLVRGNDAWDEDAIDAWSQPQSSMRTVLAEDPSPAPGAPTGQARVFAALGRWSTDAFQGVEQRRVMPDGMVPSDMEAEAARLAIADAGVALRDIDLVISASFGPDTLGSPNACSVHRKLGLGADCRSFAIEASFNAFSAQLLVARSMIASGAARRALLVQSSAPSRMLDMNEQSSLWLGDAATAAVIGPVSGGRGLLASVQRTDSSIDRTLVYGVPGRRWFDEGRTVVYFESLTQARKMVLKLLDYGEDVTRRALGEAGLTAGDIQFFASHQGTVWLQSVTKAHVGLDHAASVDTFSWTASVGACNVPIQLDEGRRRGLLRDGDVALLFTGGTGITYAATVLRWGR